MLSKRVQNSVLYSYCTPKGPTHILEKKSSCPIHSRIFWCTRHLYSTHTWTFHCIVGEMQLPCRCFQPQMRPPWFHSLWCSVLGALSSGHNALVASALFHGHGQDLSQTFGSDYRRECFLMIKMPLEVASNHKCCLCRPFSLPIEHQ